MTPLDTTKLLRALRRLAPGQGRVARNNARRAVMACLAALRASLDRAFPVVPKDKPGARKRLSLDGRIRRLHARGYRPLPFVDISTRLRALAVAKISVVSFDTSTAVWVPAWVLTVPPDDHALLRKFKRDIKARKRWLVEHAITSDQRAF
jgi:hypothetical protein